MRLKQAYGRRGAGQAFQFAAGAGDDLRGCPF